MAATRESRIKMASIERFQSPQLPKSSYTPRILGHTGIRTGMLITDIRKESTVPNRPCSLFGGQPKKIVGKTASSPISSSKPANSAPSRPQTCSPPGTTPKKTPPPVPPRTNRTFSTPSPSKVVWTVGQDSTIDDVCTPVAEEESPKKKKTPPPVPKKPSHLRLIAHQQHKTPEAKPAGDHLHMRLFALLLSPVTPTPISEVVAPSHHIESKRHHRPSAAYGSTPHLDRLLKDRADFDDNNNSVSDIREPDVDENKGRNEVGHRTIIKQQGRSVRRKSLPLLAKNSNATTPTEAYQSDGRSGATSRCSSSFGAEQGSTSSHRTPSSPPPPVPFKDYAEKEPTMSSVNCSKRMGSEEQIDGEENESVVFFSTISTISSFAASRDRSVDNEKDRGENDSEKQNNSRKRCSRPSHSAKRSNTLLNAFALEQSRRTVSIIERNARIIKWLYGCSNK